MLDDNATVFIVDDDNDTRSSIAELIATVGIHTETFQNAVDFLKKYVSNGTECLLLDVRMPEMSGIELQKQLLDEDASIPVILMTAYADVTMAVQAMKAGAVDFIQKPFREQVLLESVQHALEIAAHRKRKNEKNAKIKQKLARLTARENQILQLLVTGKSNKLIGFELGISQKTVDFHRAHILTKMNAGSVVELAPLMQQLRNS